MEKLHEEFLNIAKHLNGALNIKPILYGVKAMIHTNINNYTSAKAEVFLS